LSQPQEAILISTNFRMKESPPNDFRRHNASL
jgi:hypothetical protein